MLTPKQALSPAGILAVSGFRELLPSLWAAWESTSYQVLPDNHKSSAVWKYSRQDTLKLISMVFI